MSCFLVIKLLIIKMFLRIYLLFVSKYLRINMEKFRAIVLFWRSPFLLGLFNWNYTSFLGFKPLPQPLSKREGGSWRGYYFLLSLYKMILFPAFLYFNPVE